MATDKITNLRRRGKLVDLTGQKFHRLLVIDQADAYKNGYACWTCRCDCGNELVVKGIKLRRGQKSCGCFQKENPSRLKHGKSTTTEYNIWLKMKSRCLNPQDKSYVDYGGRDITICSEWLNDFEQFLTDMGPRPSPEHSIERINNNGGYYKDNCKWATRREQNLNKRNIATIIYNGKTTPIHAVAIQNGLRPWTLKRRLKRGLSLEKALLLHNKRS